MCRDSFRYLITFIYPNYITINRLASRNIIFYSLYKVNSNALYSKGKNSIFRNGLETKLNPILI